MAPVVTPWPSASWASHCRCPLQTAPLSGLKYWTRPFSALLDDPQRQLSWFNLTNSQQERKFDGGYQIIHKGQRIW
jgi:hypothetical protein